MFPKEGPRMNLSEPTRAWVYRVLLAVIPILTAYGVVDDQLAPLFIALGAAVLGTGLAVGNTSTKGDD